MSTQAVNDDRIALLQGTLNLRILKTFSLGWCPGQGIARLIRRRSKETFFQANGAA